MLRRQVLNEGEAGTERVTEQHSLNNTFRFKVVVSVHFPDMKKYFRYYWIEVLYVRVEDVILLFSSQKVNGAKAKHALFWAHQHGVSSTLHIWTK